MYLKARILRQHFNKMNWNYQTPAYFKEQEQKSILQIRP